MTAIGISFHLCHSEEAMHERLAAAWVRPVHAPGCIASKTMVDDIDRHAAAREQAGVKRHLADMSKPRHPLCIVIRIPDVRLTRSALETALGMTLDRYEAEGDTCSAYAQIDIPRTETPWTAAHECIVGLGESLRQLRSDELIGLPYLDIAVAFPSSVLSTSLTVPVGLAAAVGKIGMAIEVSIYRTEEVTMPV
jgi:hypothetical protein